MKGENRVIDINRYLGSSHYVNPIGGIPLYEKQHFTEYGLKPSFLQPEGIDYPQ
ncbi:WbqC family protein [Methylobacter psychrophilus]|uniref:WbqC family protein n=1 Tax=Methylobacter psychrophilus TaxID=96941 RepID=UPI0021D49FF7|nr:WbqC family protein [Methylobacter psychrophilus]